MKKRLLIGLLGVSLLAQVHAADVVVFSDDFNGALPPEISGAGFLASVESYSGIGGFSGSYLRNSSFSSFATLTLTGLPTHDNVDIDFLLAVIDSWDGISGGCCNPDFFNVSVDGTPVLTASYSQFVGNTVSPAGTLLTAGSDLAVSATWADEGYDMSGESALSLPHSASTLTVDFFADGAGWQAGDDESFAIDNLKVTVHTTGVPDGGSTAGLLALGVCVLAVARRQRA